MLTISVKINSKILQTKLDRNLSADARLNFVTLRVLFSNDISVPLSFLRLRRLLHLVLKDKGLIVER